MLRDITAIWILHTFFFYHKPQWKRFLYSLEMLFYAMKILYLSWILIVEIILHPLFFHIKRKRKRVSLMRYTSHRLWIYELGKQMVLILEVCLCNLSLFNFFYKKNRMFLKKGHWNKSVKVVETVYLILSFD